jgi:hypothetical protein
MITMLSNSLIEQLNVNRRTCNMAMTVVFADSFCSVVWWAARAACAEVFTGSVEASTRLQEPYYIGKNPSIIYGRIYSSNPENAHMLGANPAAKSRPSVRMADSIASSSSGHCPMPLNTKLLQ